jgi:hypothetical protein
MSSLRNYLKIISSTWLPISTDHFVRATKCNETISIFAMVIQCKIDFTANEI